MIRRTEEARSAKVVRRINLADYGKPGGWENVCLQELRGNSSSQPATHKHWRAARCSSQRRDWRSNPAVTPQRRRRRRRRRKDGEGGGAHFITCTQSVINCWLRDRITKTHLDRIGLDCNNHIIHNKIIIKNPRSINWEVMVFLTLENV